MCVIGSRDACLVVCGGSCISRIFLCLFVFFFNDTATTEIYTLSLHDALPIYVGRSDCLSPANHHHPKTVDPRSLGRAEAVGEDSPISHPRDRGAQAFEENQRRAESRLRSFRSEEHTSELQSHSFISYAVFCLKKKIKTNTYQIRTLEKRSEDTVESRHHTYS